MEKGDGNGGAQKIDQFLVRVGVRVVGCISKFGVLDVSGELYSSCRVQL